jgi:hypothetical protein
MRFLKTTDFEPPYKVLNEYAGNGFSIIEIVKGKFTGLQFTFGRVKLSEENGVAVMDFDYHIIRPIQDFDPVGFKEFAGPILADIMLGDVLTRKAVYKGGS